MGDVLPTGRLADSWDVKSGFGLQKYYPDTRRYPRDSLNPSDPFIHLRLHRNSVKHPAASKSPVAVVKVCVCVCVCVYYYRSQTLSLLFRCHCEYFVVKVGQKIKVRADCIMSNHAWLVFSSRKKTTTSFLLFFSFSLSFFLFFLDKEAS